MKKRLAIGGAVGAVVGALAISMGAAGAGHGTYIPAAVLFPVSMLIAVSSGNVNAVAATLAVMQYPIYGVTVAGERSSPLRWLALISFHLLLALLSFLSVQRSEGFG
jgi:hypothetical protein